MGNNKIDGYFEYVVPPLEGFWWNKDEKMLIIGIKKILNGIL